MRDIADAWQMEITGLSWEFEKLLRDLGPGEINFRTDPGSWSIAENLAHIIRVNASYYPVFDEILAKQYKPPFIRKIPFVVNAMGNLLQRSMSGTFKTKTFPMWEPSRQEYDLDVVAEFNRQQMELSAYVQKLDPYFETGLVIQSPANRWLVYTLDQAIDIIIAHEKRHLKQSQKVLEIQKNI